MRRAVWMLTGLLGSSIACTQSSDVVFGETSGGPGNTSGGVTSSSGSVNNGSGGGSSGSEPTTPPHCGDPNVPKCADGEACRDDDDCTSINCTGGRCIAPSPTDGKKNGDESDVDCGGAVADKCVPGKHCEADSDCASEACPSSKTCMSSRSCRRHFGGETCGAGEVGAANAAHEDCCLSIQPGTKDYRVDKYLITAGRMRAFIEEVALEYAGQPNVKAWVAAHPDRVPDWDTAWNDSLPSNSSDIVSLIGTGRDPGAGWNRQGQANGCYVQSGGAPTFWHSKDALAQVGDMERSFTRDELDVKALNCTPAALFAAFCAYDGGRLASSAEWEYAVRGDQTEAQRLFPWGNPVAGNKAAVDADIKLHASYDKNYLFPLVALPGAPVLSDGLPVDRSFEVPAPGRFPLGAGPFGHADLLGIAETMVLDGAQLKMVRQYAFQEAYYGVVTYGTLYNMRNYTSHYAVAARCSRPL